MDTAKKSIKKSKTLLLATLPATIVLVTAAVNVQAAPEVYGKLNVSLQQETQDAGGADTQDNWQLESNASRLGVKGTTDLGSTGLKGVYKLEYEVATDDGINSNGREFKQRNIYVGAQGGFGTVIAGHFDTPTKEAQGKIDLFNDYLWADIAGVISGENRPDNIVMYSSPKIANGLTLNFAFMPGEDTVATGGNDGPADAFSASAVYDSDRIYAALAVDSDVLDTASLSLPVPLDVEKNSIRLAGQFKIPGNVILGAILQGSENANESADGKADQYGVILSGSYTLMNDNVFKLQVGRSKTDKGAPDDTVVTSWSAGYDRMLGKDAKVYVYYSGWDSDAGGPQSDKDTVGVGYELKFQ